MTSKSSLGDAESSLGDAESSPGGPVQYSAGGPSHGGATGPGRRLPSPSSAEGLRLNIAHRLSSGRLSQGHASALHAATRGRARQDAGMDDDQPPPTRARVTPSV